MLGQMKYYNADIVFQEVPDEISLAVNITNCPNDCIGCHSMYLHEDVGIVLTDNEVDRMLKPYIGSITCFCIMGGDACRKEVEHVANYVKTKYRLKVAWCSGQYRMPDNISSFDYIKLGPYIKEKGGLRSKNTNQLFFQIDNGTAIDITHVFWK